MPSSPCRPIVPLVALGLALPGLATAQDQVPWPFDPSVGQYDRAVRRLEQQAVTDPRGAAREAARLRRDFINEQGGVSFSPDQARIDRELGRLQGLAPAAPPEPRPPSAPEADLPSSYGDGADLPSMQRELRLVGRLLDRAQAGIEQRNPERAGSDLAAAAASLGGLRRALPPEELQPLAARLDGLRRELAALPSAGG